MSKNQSVGQYSNKVELDKFYTHEQTAKECLGFVDLKKYDFVIEPSAGDGSFLNNIVHQNKVGIDLKPDHESILKHDWFKYKIDDQFLNVLVVGNPPFGRRNKLSINFIKHAVSFPNVKAIAFILPDVFNKHTLQKYIPKSFRLSHVHKLPKNSFKKYGKPFDMPCSFFIFDQSEGVDHRFNPETYKETKDFRYGTQDDYDFFVLGTAPHVVKAIKEKTNRGYFIKVKKGVNVEQVKNKFRNKIWKGNSSVSGGANWFTKPELIQKYLEQ